MSATKMSKCTCLEVFGEDPACDLHGGPLRLAVYETFGGRCGTFDPECETCQAWTEIDRLSPSRLSSNDEAGVTGVARFIAERLFNTDFDSLRDDAIGGDFKPIIYTQWGGHKLQGGKADLVALAKEMLALPSQPPTPASGDQMDVVAYKGQSGALYLPHHGDPKEDAALVTLDAAQKAIEQERQKYEKAVEEINEYMIKFGNEGIRAEAAEARIAELEKAMVALRDGPGIECIPDNEVQEMVRAALRSSSLDDEVK